MPGKYEAIRDKMKRQGKSDKEAKRRAAKIYNAQRPQGAAPVTRNYEKTVAKRAAAKRGAKKAARKKAARSRA